MSKNDITGDTIQSKLSTQKYRDNWDLIFRKKNEQTETVSEDARLPSQDTRHLQLQSGNDSSSSS